jgi:CheY-like chemotaxis protein
VVDLNQLILSTCGLLRRLIGEHIELVTLPAVDLGLVTIDTGQFQQILVNLAVNARDAMPHGGRLTIATRNVEVGGHDGIAHPELPPGSYVRLAIEDTGSGMDDLVLSHVFEPFFTTKPTGEGTGLGLATCYGIVKQAGGHIAVRSRPDDGTRFEIHLPRVPAELSRPAAESDVALETRGGDETILLVEDEPGVRSLAGRALAARGYRVLAASSGSEALALARSYPERIHLLLSDVVMPRMSGPEIAERLVALRPDMKVLFMSGYTGSGLARPDWLPESAPLLTKPFSAQLLARRVRDELDRPPA